MSLVSRLTSTTSVCSDVGHVDVVVLDSSQGDSSFQVGVRGWAELSWRGGGRVLVGAEPVGVASPPPLLWLPHRSLPPVTPSACLVLLASTCSVLSSLPACLPALAADRHGAAHQAGAPRPGCHLRQRGRHLAGGWVGALPFAGPHAPFPAAPAPCSSPIALQHMACLGLAPVPAAHAPLHSLSPPPSCC